MHFFISASKDNTAVGSGNSFGTLLDISQIQAAIGGQLDALTAGNSDNTSILTKALGKLPIG